MPTLSLEPQAQLIWQHLDIDPTADPITTLTFHLDNAFTGRLGLQLEDREMWADTPVQPYFLANFWHGFNGSDDVIFNGVTTLQTPFQSTAFEGGAGIVAQVSQQFGLYARGSYATEIGGAYRQAFQGNIGLRVTW